MSSAAPLTGTPGRTMDFEQLESSVRQRLRAVGQEHLLEFLPELGADRRASLLLQATELDIEALPRLVREYVHAKPVPALPEAVIPAPYFALSNSRSDTHGVKAVWDRSRFRAIGQELIRQGKVAAFVVAGGQGSRLGYDGPKGCFPAGAVTNKPLFAIFADAILGAAERYGAVVPWYIMTSPLNHAATVNYFEANRYFSLPGGSDSVRFFAQGVMPSLDIVTGRVLLSAKDQIATNPDGHGGSVKALHVSGALADMRRRGVEYVSYFQVDNPIVNFLDPLFLGLHAGASESSGDMSSKMVPKTSPDEKVGVFCAAGAGPHQGRTSIVEYSDLPASLAEERNTDGSLRFIAGSIAVHVLGVPFVERLNTDPEFRLPYHRAEKKVPCIDPHTGASITPTTNNAVKLEAFVFDAIPLCPRSIVLEADRVEEFAPIKNASGADSAESSRMIQTRRAARWLERCGVAVPQDRTGQLDCVLEVSPRTATTADELAVAAHGGRVKLPRAIERGQRLAI